MSRFEEEKSISSHYKKNLKLYPFFGAGLAAAGMVLTGRIGYYLLKGSKLKGEMYFLQTRVYTQGTFFVVVAIPMFYNIGLYASRKVRGIPTEIERKPLPKDLEYAPVD